MKDSIDPKKKLALAKINEGFEKLKTMMKSSNSHIKSELSSFEGLVQKEIAADKKLEERLKAAGATKKFSSRG